MANYQLKQSSSYPIRYQVLQYNSATCFSTNFGTETSQIRVLAQLQGWVTINQSTGDSIIASSAGGTGMIVAANTAAGDYFTVRPGQIFTFSSTSTSTGAVSVTEMS
jgi:hypothetical protein